MRWSYEKCAEYLSRVAAFIEQFGATLDLSEGADLELLEEDDGTLSFEIMGSMPDGTHPALTGLVIREGFRRISPDLCERLRYEYELVEGRGTSVERSTFISRSGSDNGFSWWCTSTVNGR